jgi:hypothetical protein
LLVSVDELLVDEDDDVSVLLGAAAVLDDESVVPLAPMLVVPVPLVLDLLVSLEVLGVLLVELLGVPDDAPMVLALFLLASTVLDVPEALVPPPEEPPLAPPLDCATAIPLTARAAAAARVVSVFLVLVMMSCSLNGKPPKGSKVDGKPAHCRLEQDYLRDRTREVSVCRHSL